MPDTPAHCTSRRGLRAWIAPNTRLSDALPPVGDPDQLLTDPQCTLVKFQRKVAVGLVRTPAGLLYIKRHNVWAPHVALRHCWQPSPARRAWLAAAALRARGVAVPDVLAALELRRAGFLLASFFVTRAVEGAVTVDVAWHQLATMPQGLARRRALRAFAASLGAFYRQLHEAGVRHRDLKDANVLVRPDGTYVVLDLEDVEVRTTVPLRDRQTNLMQLARTLGRSVPRAYRLRCLRAYLGESADRAERRSWVAHVTTAMADKDRRRPPRRTPDRWATLTCTVVCQDEAAQIAGALRSVTWCHEVVVVDGGSRDDTPAIASTFGARVITNPWPGYRAQKQFALDHSTSDWVLNLDADERVTDELATEIRAALAVVGDAVDGFEVPRLVSYLGRWWYRGGWYPRPILRVVRRARTVWGGTDPHDRPVVPGRVVALKNPLVHYTYSDVADHLRSVGKLTAVAASQVPATRAVGFGRLVGEPAWRFFRSLVINRGALEGAAGLFVAATDAFYTFLRFARVWAHRRAAR